MVDVRALGQRLALTRGECWLLYVWLGELAPFVRNQLAVARNGGNLGVSISTPEEGRDVLAAIAVGGSASALTSGLRSLQTVLADDGRGGID